MKALYEELDAGRRAARHVAVFDQPTPETVKPQSLWFEGPLAGNGNMGLGINGSARHVVLHLGRNDFWNDIEVPFAGTGTHASMSGNEAGEDPWICYRNPLGRIRRWPRSAWQPGVIGFARLHLEFPGLPGVAVRHEQDLNLAEIRSLLAEAVTLRTVVAAQDSCLLLEIANLQDGPRKILLTAEALQDARRDYPTAAGMTGGLAWLERSTNPTGQRWRTRAALALAASEGVSQVRRLNARQVQLEFLLPPGGRTLVVATQASSNEASEPLPEALRLAGELDFASVEARHRGWWRDWWRRSAISLADPLLESSWYGSFYLLGCISRAGRLAPGLYGPWVFHDYPMWCGDYHLNYNFQSTFLGCFSANRGEAALPAFDFLNSCLPLGRMEARRFNSRGIHLPVSVGPAGIANEENDWGQRSNALFCAILHLWHWRHYADENLLRTHLYPYLSEVAAFWESYLEEDAEGRLVVRDSCANEDSGAEWLMDQAGRPCLDNPYLDLLLLHDFFTSLLEIGSKVGETPDRLARWREILFRLASPPTCLFAGREVFAQAEGSDRPGWYFTSSLFVNDLEEWDNGRWRDVARQTLDAADNRAHDNALPINHAGAVRLRCPDAVARLRQHLLERMLPNYGIYQFGGVVETLGITLAINEMLLQSHGGVIRLFPCCPPGAAAFRNLRAQGAFLLSASRNEQAEVEYFQVACEVGGTFRFVNPWPGETPRAEGICVRMDENNIWAFETQAGGLYRIQPGNSKENLRHENS
jgi:alpha-L-fucosidase 2